MSIALRPWRRVLVLVAAVVVLVAVRVLRRPNLTGAEANKNCPGVTASPGDTITCNFNVQNTGEQAAVITDLVRHARSGGAPVDISCTAATTYDEGDTLPNGLVCSGSFQQTIPNDPALCGTAIT